MYLCIFFIKRSNELFRFGALGAAQWRKRLCTPFPSAGIVLKWILRNIQIKCDRKKHQF